MPLATGARLGPYRIDAEIGAGGMGHVFRATDTRLDRAVAVKVLPQDRWSDSRVRMRFEREARALSALSHPNLCALYDVGELTQSGTSSPYIVMELLEGETLRDRMERGRLSVRRALLFASQIASGLAAAHQKGVIHRDLKPENVFVTRGEMSDELLKILDFGLATTTIPPQDSSTHLRTEPGIVMGTAHYMSPEQVRGATLDARSDIFCLGIVLFEMLTGDVPFHASSTVETMNAILVEEPADLLGLMPAIPESVEALVHRCLEKDPSQRFSSSRDLAFALESAAKSVSTSTPRPQVPIATPEAQTKPQSSRTIVPRMLLLALTAALLLTVAWLARQKPPPEPPRLRMLTHSGRDSQPAASPDGRLIAYVSSRDGGRRIWLQQLGDGTEAPVTSGPDDWAPRFSPDGSHLLFTRTASNGTHALYRVAVVGGEPRKLIDDGFEGDWSPDGSRIAFIRTRGATERLATLCVARVDGGSVLELAASGEDEFGGVRWSPTGEWIALTAHPRETTGGSILLVRPASKEQRQLTRPVRHGQVSAPAWTTDGRELVYAELEALTGTGLPRRRGSSAIVLHNVASGNARVLLRSPHSAADSVALLGNGRLVFTEDVTRQSLQEIVLDGSTPPRWLSRGMGMDRQPAYARGGNSVLFTSERGGNVDLWEMLLENGRVRRLTDHSAIDWDPHASADGRSLFWSSNRGGHFEVWTASLDGANPQQITQDGVDAENPTLSAAGDWVFYDSSNPKTDGVWRVPRAGGAAVPVIAGETTHPAVSPDGQWVVYGRPVAGGTVSIDVARVSDGQVFALATVRGMLSVRGQWVGASRTVAFRAPDERGRITIFTQDFVPGSDTSATRRALVTSDSDDEVETFAISPDGTRAIVSFLDEASGLMMVEGIAALP